MEDKLEFKPWYLVTNSGGVIGVLSYSSANDGWLFMARVSGRGNTRKFQADMNNAIPAWAFNASDDLLDSREFQSWKKKHCK